MSKEIKALIIDDEKSSHEVLTVLLGEISSHILIKGNAYSVKQGYQLIKEIQPDVVFLDVQMNDGTAFDLLDMLDEMLFKVIFTTAHDHFAIDALRMSAIDFLLKPLKMNELKNAIDRLNKVTTYARQQRDPLAEPSGSNLHSPRIAVNSLQKICYIPVRDIIFCKANGPYTEIHLREGTYLMASKTLSHFDDILIDFNFYRVHRSYLINMNEVLELHKVTNSVLMSNGIKIRISYNAKEFFLKKMLGL